MMASRCLLALLLGLLGVAPAWSADEKRPNILVILTDDQRHDAMGCAGHPFFKTPNMDRLAKEGVRFTNAFVTTSLCSPSRASFLSGLYAHTHKVLDNFTDYPNDLASYPRRLQQAGYETAYIGKYHMGENDDQQRPGFDFWMSHKGQGNYYDNEFNINGKRQEIKGYYTHVVTDHAIDFMKKERDKPFMLVLGHKAPHGGPIVPEKKYEKLFADADIKLPLSATPGKQQPDWLRIQLPTWHGIKGPLYGLKKHPKFVSYYLATIQSVDDSLGRILAALEKSGQLDNTLIVYTSDNGFALGEHGRVDKRTMYEESIRIPLLVRYPKLAKAGTKIDEMILSVDLAPTLVDIGGGKPMKNIHGRSFKPLLLGQEVAWRDAFYYEYNYEKEFPYTPNVRGVRTRQWKYIHYPHGDGKPDRHKAELYNLADDPLERVNLIDDPKYKAKVEEMKKALLRVQQETGARPDKMPLDAGIKSTLPKF